VEIKLTCPQARYISEMRIGCRACGDLCAHQYYKSCKGWWALTPMAERCPLRDKKQDEGSEDHGQG